METYVHDDSSDRFFEIRERGTNVLLATIMFFNHPVVWSWSILIWESTGYGPNRVVTEAYSLSPSHEGAKLLTPSKEEPTVISDARARNLSA